MNVDHYILSPFHFKQFVRIRHTPQDLEDKKPLSGRIPLKEERKQLIQNISKQVREAKQTNNWDKINTTLMIRRRKWVEHNLKDVKREGSDVKKAYQFFLIEYLGLDPSEVPIVYEDEKRIIWWSYN